MAWGADLDGCTVEERVHSIIVRETLVLKHGFGSRKMVGHWKTSAEKVHLVAGVIVKATEYMSRASI